jgi:hypothetical protein
MISLAGRTPGRDAAWKSSWLLLAWVMVTTAGKEEISRRQLQIAMPMLKASSAVNWERMMEDSWAAILSS